MDSIDSSSAISVYAEAKGEYTKQLCVFLMNPLQKFFLELLDTARAEEADKRRVLKKYQELLSQIPDWNIDKVSRETGKIQEDSGCDYLEELLTAVFIAHTKVLSAIRLNSRNKSIQITVPKLEHFIHRTMSESARRVWSNVYLFADSISSLEKQKNLRQLEVILHECIQQAVRGMLPVKNLLRDYLSEPDEVENDVGTGSTGVTGGAAAAVVADADAIATPVDPVVGTETATPTVVSVPGETQTEASVTETAAVTAAETAAVTVAEPVPAEEPKSETSATAPTIVVDTEPRVHFSDFNTVFKDGKTEIVPSVEDDVDDEFADVLRIHDEVKQLSMDDFESLDDNAGTSIEYETLN
jgi:hypothetical protein